MNQNLIVAPVNLLLNDHSLPAPPVSQARGCYQPENALFNAFKRITGEVLRIIGDASACARLPRSELAQISKGLTPLI
jgi:hypothetical protein